MPLISSLIINDKYVFFIIFPHLMFQGHIKIYSFADGAFNKIFSICRALIQNFLFNNSKRANFPNDKHKKLNKTL